jgi:hypothetical protein
MEGTEIKVCERVEILHCPECFRCYEVFYMPWEKYRNSYTCTSCAKLWRRDELKRIDQIWNDPKYINATVSDLPVND